MHWGEFEAWLCGPASCVRAACWARNFHPAALDSERDAPAQGAGGEAGGPEGARPAVELPGGARVGGRPRGTGAGLQPPQQCSGAATDDVAAVRAMPTVQAALCRVFVVVGPSHYSAAARRLHNCSLRWVLAAQPKLCALACQAMGRAPPNGLQCVSDHHGTPAVFCTCQPCCCARASQHRLGGYSWYPQCTLRVPAIPASKFNQCLSQMVTECIQPHCVLHGSFDFARSFHCRGFP